MRKNITKLAILTKETMSKALIEGIMEVMIADILVNRICLTGQPTGRAWRPLHHRGTPHNILNQGVTGPGVQHAHPWAGIDFYKDISKNVLYLLFLFTIF